MRRKQNNIIIKENHAEIEIISKKYGIFYTLIDLNDIDKIKNHCWGIHDVNNYLIIETKLKINNKYSILKLHRLIMNCPDGMIVDHINHNTLDNRKENLRICTYKENSENRNVQKNSKSGIRGIFWNKQISKWVAKIGHNYKHIIIGYFSNIEDAEKAVIKARKKYFTHSQECILV